MRTIYGRFLRSARFLDGLWVRLSSLFESGIYSVSLEDGTCMQIGEVRAASVRAAF